MKQPRRDLHQANRRSWNHATRAHNAHKADQAGFLRRGGSALFPEELELLGDLRGLRLAHLLCNAGQDSLSLARLGATVVGVDISDVAIDFARELSTASGIPATFVNQDVYDWLAARTDDEPPFDVVFSSYGALCWLSDLTGWADGVARILAPGGRLVVVEFHPVAMMFGEDGGLEYPYFGDEPVTWPDGVGDYVGDSTGALSPSGHVDVAEPYANPHPVHEFLWTLGDIVSAVAAAGDLQVESLREYPFSNGFGFGGLLVEAEERRFRLPPDRPAPPLMYGLVARRPG